MKKTIALVLLSSFLCAADHPFNYDLQVSSIEGEPGARTILCFHGYGQNSSSIQNIKEQAKIKETLIGFNFPDYDLEEREIEPEKMTFGTIQELLPALYLLKYFVVEQGLEAIDLYGFSAGGGAVINVIAALKKPLFNKELAEIGITSQEKKALLKAIQNGVILLDAPLKSIEEIIDFREPDSALEIIARQYGRNALTPIKSLRHLRKLSLNIIVHFEDPDEAISNRDDKRYIKRLKKFNSEGKTIVTKGSGAGHEGFHPALWNAYRDLITASQ